MTTKQGNLSLQEKRRIEELTKCLREKKRIHIVEELNALRIEIEKPYDFKIDNLQRQAEMIRIERAAAVKEAGYGKIHERGCFDTHPRLDKFDEETNAILVRLWATGDPSSNPDI